MWGAIEADFHREYRFDLSAPGALASKTWRWFVVRLGNLSGDSATRHAMRNTKRHDPQAAMSALAAASKR